MGEILLWRGKPMEVSVGKIGELSWPGYRRRETTIIIRTSVACMYYYYAHRKGTRRWCGVASFPQNSPSYLVPTPWGQSPYDFILNFFVWSLPWYCVVPPLRYHNIYSSISLKDSRGWAWSWSLQILNLWASQGSANWKLSSIKACL